MNPMTFEQAMAALGVCVGVVAPTATLALSARREAAAERQRRAEEAMERQRISDKLDEQGRDVRETRDTLRSMSQEVTAQKVLQAATESTLADHERRIGAVERRCDLRHGHGVAGGTE